MNLVLVSFVSAWAPAGEYHWYCLVFNGGSQLCQPFLRLSLLMAGHSIKSSLMHWCTMHAAETSHILQCKDHIGFRLATKGYSKH